MLRTETRRRLGNDHVLQRMWKTCGERLDAFLSREVGTRHAKNPSVHEWLQRHVACNPATPLPRSPPTRRPPSLSSPTTAHAACPPRTNRCDFPNAATPRSHTELLAATPGSCTVTSRSFPGRFLPPSGLGFPTPLRPRCCAESVTSFRQETPPHLRLLDCISPCFRFFFRQTETFRASSPLPRRLSRLIFGLVFCFRFQHGSSPDAAILCQKRWKKRG